MKELLEQADADLKTWGEWVNDCNVIAGYGNSSVSRLDKDTTRAKPRKRRVLTDSLSVNIKYVDGRPIAAHYTKDKLAIPAQEITTPKPLNLASQMQTQPDDRDTVGMEIDSYIGILKQINPTAAKLATHYYRYHWGKEDSMPKLRISRRVYYHLLDAIKRHVVSCRGYAAHIQGQ